MQANKMEEARQMFAAVALKEPANQDAKVWSALLDLSAIAVDPATVAFYKDKIGAASYPSNLDQFLSETWMNTTVWGTKSGFAVDNDYGEYVRGTVTPSADGSYYKTMAENGDWVTRSGIFTPSSSGDTYSKDWYTAGQGYVWGPDYLAANPGVDAYDYVHDLVDLSQPQMFPDLSPVSGFAPALQSGGYAPMDYTLLLMYNVMTRNPAGANAAVDALLAGPFGAKFDAIVSRLDAINGATRTPVPWSLVTDETTVPDMGGGTKAGSPLPALSLGKPELLVLAAQLKMQKAFLQYMASVNLSYDVTKVYNLFTVVNTPNYNFPDTNVNGVADVFETFWSEAPGIYASSALTERNAASRTASKATFLDAAEDISAAYAGWKTALTDPNSYYSQSLKAFFVDPSAGITDAVELLTNLQNGVDRLRTSVSSGTTLYLPAALTDGVLSPVNVLMGPVLTWPTAAGAGITGLKPAALWASNALDFRSWVEGDATAKDFAFYWAPGWAEDTNSDEVVDAFEAFAYTASPTAADFGLDPNTQNIQYLDVMLALKVKNSRMADFVEGALDDPASYFSIRYWDYVMDDGVIDLTVPADVPLLINWYNK